MEISKVRKKIRELKREEAKPVEQNRDTEIQKDKDTEPQKDRDAEPQRDRNAEIQRDKEIQKDRDTEVTESEIELIAFKVSSEEYAVKLVEMQEIINYRKVTRVPRTPHYLKGVTFLRGKVMPVIDLKERLEISGKNGEGKRIIILSTSKGEPIGAVVSSFIRVLRFPEREILPPPATLSEKEKRFIKGVIRIDDRFISLLNIEELIKMEAV